MRREIALATLIAAVGTAAASGDDCTSNVVVNSQDDLNFLDGCGEFSGDLILGPKLTGSITIESRYGGKDGGRYIIEFMGRVTNLECPNASSEPKDCTIHKPELTSMNTSGSAVSKLQLQDLPKLKTLQISNDWSRMDLSLKDLPELELLNVTLDTARYVDDMLSTRDLSLVNLPKLKSLGKTNVVGATGNVEMSDIGLSTINFTSFEYGSASSIHLSSSNGDTGKMANFTKQTNLYDDSPSGPSYKDDDEPVKANITITGTGSTVVTFGFKPGAKYTFSDPKGVNYTLTGIGEVKWDAENWDALQADDFHLANSSLKELDLRLRDVGSLAIRDNAQLEMIRFSRKFADHNFKDITIASNPKLSLGAEYGPKQYDDGGTETDAEQDGHDKFCWPSKNVQAMTFIGNFSQDFFDKFVHYKTREYKKIDNPPEILGDMKVDSSNDDFTCGPLDGLDRVKGEVECSFAVALKAVPVTGAMLAAAALSLFSLM